MKKSIIMPIAILSLSLILSGCASTQTQEVRTMAGISNTGVIQYPMIAKLQIDEKKVHAVAEGCLASATNNCKALAYAHALNQSGADVLIEPLYTTRDGKVTVIGFPARYVEFRELTLEDKDILLAANGASQWLPLQTEEAAVVEVTKKETGSAAAWIIGGLAGIAALLMIMVN